MKHTNEQYSSGVLDARTLGFVAVAAVLGMGFAMAVSVSAHGDPETRDAIEVAIENDDYDAWMALHSSMPMATELSKEDFETIVAMHDARAEGDYEKARELRETLDVPFGRQGMGRGIHGVMLEGRHMDGEQHDAMEAALEADDYDAWKELMGDRGPAQFVTEENFETFIAMHSAMEEGNTELADELREELGLPIRGKTSPDKGFGRHGFGPHTGR